ncbi:MAG: phenylalanine--tRNA ligase subunit beta, partial [Candidatus Eremiobacteraeota bacterium]|nr:phenylalanine--tRNA ligase subunit beta [Candidatus Eremiobacteraeota bacterium]
MRVPLGWLKEFVDVPGDAQSIAHRLGMLGFPVEAIDVRPAISGVVLGKIVELEKHPNADRLQVGRVDVGEAQPLTIATAATNVAQGQIIAVARIGAQLPSMKIEPRKMRGIASEGMMISGEELALPGEWFEDGIMQFEADRPLGTDLVAAFGLNEAVLDVEVTSNRVDAMSMIGIARELAASYGLPLRLPSFENPGTAAEPSGEAPDVALLSPDCRRFVAQRFDGVRVAPAPAWMRIRLALAGQRPIGNLVDVSNYVMLETGQPLHFYDAARIHGGKLFVRDGHPDEKAVTLDDVERTLDPQSLVIADDRQTLCLAGLMGAEAGEVRDETTAIVLEAANFNGARVRRMSQALGLRSEASSRHEKALAPAMTDIGAARAAQLLVEIGATAYRPHAFGAALKAASAIELAPSEVARLLGMVLTPQRIAKHLEALGCTVELRDNVLAVVAPAWRRDLVADVDLVEEVARMEGY